MRQIILPMLWWILGVNSMVYSQSKTINYELQGSHIYPEAITTNPSTGVIYVSSIKDGSIQKIEGQHVSYFKKPGEDGLTSSIRLKINKIHKELWVFNFDFGYSIYSAPQSQQKKNILVFDLVTGRLKYKIPIDRKIFHNKATIVFDKEGNTYLTDTFFPAIFKVNTTTQRLQYWLEDDQFQGGIHVVAYNPIGSFFIVFNEMKKKLYKVKLYSKAIYTITVLEDTPIDNPEGIQFSSSNSLLAINQGELCLWEFNSYFSEVRLSKASSKSIKTNYAITVAADKENLYIVNGDKKLEIHAGNTLQNEEKKDIFMITEVPLHNFRW